jgi:hypothetical protein
VISSSNIRHRLLPTNLARGSVQLSVYLLLHNFFGKKTRPSFIHRTKHTNIQHKKGRFTQSLVMLPLRAPSVHHHHHHPLIPLSGVGITYFLVPFSSITRHIHAHGFYSHVILHTVHPSFLRSISSRDIHSYSSLFSLWDFPSA